MFSVGVIRYPDASKNKFMVVQKMHEKELSNQMVRKFIRKSEADKYVKFLNEGGCFRGEIPDFMFNGKR